MDSFSKFTNIAKWFCIFLSNNVLKNNNPKIYSDEAVLRETFFINRNEDSFI